MHEPTQEPRDAARLLVHIAALEREVSELRQKLAKQSSDSEDLLVFPADIHEDLFSSDVPYRALVEMFPHAIWIAEPDGSTSYANRYWYELSGLSLEQTVGLGWTSALHPEDAAKVVDRQRQTIATGVSPENELRFRRATDGQYRWHLTKAVPLKDPNGNIVKWIGIAVDIHDQKAAAVAIEEAEERLRLAVESAGMGTWDYYPETGETRWSLRAKEILGLAPADEMDYQGFLARVHPEDRARVEDALRCAVDPQKWSEYDVEYRVVWPNGEVRWVNARGKCFFADGPQRRWVRFTGMVLDNTERMRAEHERAKLIAVIQKSPDFIGLSDTQGKVLFINRAGQKLVGLRDDAEAASKRIEDYFLAEDLSRFQEHVLPLIRSGKVWEGEFRFKNFETGKTIVLDARGFGIFDAFGHLTNIATVSRDISERSKVEEQLRLVQKMEAVGRLAGGIAHDFNNLLTIIKGYSQILEDHLQADPEDARIVKEIANAATRAAALTNELLAFSRRQIVQPRILDLNKAILRIQGMLQRLVGEDIVIQTNLAEDLWPVLMDPSQVDQILINLTANARDAMPHGGNIVLETQNRELPCSTDAEQMDAAPGPYVCLSFRDSGLGMDAETLSHIFEPFFTTKPVGKGTGLGLATIYGIMQQSSGHVVARSQIGQGTVFNLYLPRAAEGVREEPRAPESADLRGTEKILVVEDEASLRRMVAEYIRKWGYTVYEAGQATEALALAEAHPIHLLVTDIVMPGTSGHVLASLLASRHPGICVIYMSGYSEHAALKEALLQPGTAFMQKPFEPKDILRKVRETLDTTKRHRQNSSTTQ
ncbi:MAG TPA: PAS domain-containing protein [Candidatus Solibacter sp.]|nr:PAS domain-containing protein [Candidatus Solibacter sp.]